MTIAERNNKLKHFITCLKCEVSGKCCDDNCSTQYDAGNMGEIIENFEAISKALEQESVLDKIFCIVHPLSIMSTSELEHKAIMQVAEMLEPLCLPESEDQE